MKRIVSGLVGLIGLVVACNGPLPAEDRGETSSHVDMPACGTPLSEVDGIYSYSNGANETTGESCAGSGDNGLLYQCVEYAQRYFHQRFGGPARWSVSAAKEMCSNYPAGTTRHDVDGYTPQHGDLIVWTNSTYGHVAVVRDVNAGSITIVEQNGGWSTSGSRTLSASDGYRSAGCFISADANAGAPKAQIAATDGTLSPDQLAQVAHAAGVPCGENLTLAVAVALGESGGVVDATHVNDGGSIDRGLWQVNSLYWPQYGEECLFTAECNATAMNEISRGGTNWQPWAAYTNGRYEQFLGEAQAAAAAECGGGGGGGAGAAPAACAATDYYGLCDGPTSIWLEDGVCRSRDCAAEGKTCGLISEEVGLGCR